MPHAQHVYCAVNFRAMDFSLHECATWKSHPMAASHRIAEETEIVIHNNFFSSLYASIPLLLATHSSLLFIIYVMRWADLSKTLLVYSFHSTTFIPIHPFALFAHLLLILFLLSNAIIQLHTSIEQNVHEEQKKWFHFSLLSMDHIRVGRRLCTYSSTIELEVCGGGSKYILYDNKTMVTVDGFQFWLN